MDEIEVLRLRAKAKAKAQRERGEIAAPASPAPEEEDGIGTKALSVVMRTLDFPGGLARVAYKGAQNLPRAAAKGLEEIGIDTELAKQPHLVTSEDFENALYGRAPTMGEFAVREGAEPGIANTIGGIAGDIALDPTTYMTLGGSAIPKLAKYGRALNEATESAGKKIYKSGLKELDIEAAKYGKEPVSDLLMKEGVTGSYEQIQKRMDDLAKSYGEQRDFILKQATRAGAEVDMAEAMAPMLNKIAEIEKSNDPNLVRLAKAMRKDAEQYISRGAKESQEILRPLYKQSAYQPAARASEVGSYVKPERKFVDLYPGGADVVEKTKILPDQSVALDVNLNPIKESSTIGRAPLKGSYIKEGTGGFTPGKLIDIPEQYIQKAPEMALDVTERVPGPSPMQASGWKSSTYAGIGSPAYERAKFTPAGKEILKSKAFGLKEATEKAVAKKLGLQSKEELMELNQKLGQILTTDEKAAKEAAKELRKNKITTMDAMTMAGTAAASGSPQVGVASLLLKKAADISKMTGPRTKAGKALIDRAKTDMLLEKNLLYSPWVEFGRQEDL